MAIGWVKIHRSICDNPLWLSEPFTRGQAWADLIILANHKDGFIRARGVRIDVKRGQVGWSQIKLSDRWKWSRGKTKRFLNELEMDQQIIQQKNNVTTLLSITNYNEYQTNGTTDSTADGLQVIQQTDSKQYTNKNVKNEKKEITTPEKSEVTHKFSDWDMSIAKRYLEVSTENNPNSASLKKTDLNKWADAIRLLRETDKHPQQLIADVCKYALSDDFWKSNAVSIASIRCKGKNGLPKFENIMNSGIDKNIIKREKYKDIVYAD
jgi:hypothetical protein